MWYIIYGIVATKVGGLSPLLTTNADVVGAFNEKVVRNHTENATVSVAIGSKMRCVLSG